MINCWGQTKQRRESLRSENLVSINYMLASDIHSFLKTSLLGGVPG